MKHTKEFNKFYTNEIRLNPSRLKLLRDRVSNIERFLKADPIFQDLFIAIEPQGSWAHGTIVKPLDKNPTFDADVLLYLKEPTRWKAEDYVERLYRQFKTSPNYTKIVKRRTRCLVVDYRGEFHIDIVPVIMRKKTKWVFFSSEHSYVTNRNKNHLEETNPNGYLDFFKHNNDITNGNLAKTVCIAKYFRDNKRTFSVKSILLTTLLMEQVATDDIEYYSDIPSTFYILFLRLNDFLQENPQLPHISNPSLPDEDFIRHWNQNIYNNFRNRISVYSDKVHEAYHENARLRSMALWRDLFGERFGY